MGQNYRQLMLLLLGWGLFTGLAWGVTPIKPLESAETPKGIFLMWHRTPATEKDLGMPLYRQGKTLQSYTNRVRDRKHRNYLFYACVRLSTTQSIAALLEYAQQALGTGAQRDTDKETGIVTLVAGSKQDCRIVTVTPEKEGYQLQLEHVQHFVIPPRVYTAQEKKVLQMLKELTAAYRSAGHVAYRVVQRIEEKPASSPPAPQLPQVWSVDYLRPNRLTVTALVNGVVGLHITTKDGSLLVMRPGKSTVQRATGHALTIETVPELQDDAVARLMLGDSLISESVDYLALLPVAGTPFTEQAEIVLTYPINHITVRLRLDRRRLVIIRGEIIRKTPENTLDVVREYSNILLDAAATAPALPAPKPAQPQAPTSPASPPAPPQTTTGDVSDQ